MVVKFHQILVSSSTVQRLEAINQWCQKCLLGMGGILYLILHKHNTFYLIMKNYDIFLPKREENDGLYTKYMRQGGPKHLLQRLFSYSLLLFAQRKNRQ